MCHYSIDVVCNKNMSLLLENDIGLIINDVVNTGLLVIKQNQNNAVNPDCAMVVFICLKIQYVLILHILLIAYFTFSMDFFKRCDFEYTQILSNYRLCKEKKKINVKCLRNIHCGQCFLLRHMEGKSSKCSDQTCKESKSIVVGMTQTSYSLEFRDNNE